MNRQLLAAIDRVVVAAIDIADAHYGDHLLHRHPRSASSLEINAVHAALHTILWGGESERSPWHDMSEGKATTRLRVTAWARHAQALGAAAPARQQKDEEQDIEELIWWVATMVAKLAADARQRGEELSLVGVLERVRLGLAQPDGAWDKDLTLLTVARPQTYELWMGLEFHCYLLWSQNDLAQERFDINVDPYDLPIPLSLAHRILQLADMYDAGTDPQDGWIAGDWGALQRSYQAMSDELPRALGPAYQIVKVYPL